VYRYTDEWTKTGANIGYMFG